MYTGIFDSHAHYNDHRFDPDREQKLGELGERGVEMVMNIGADMETSREAVALAESHDYIYATVGVHPQEAGRLPADYLAQLEELTSHPKVRAIGEIGLDYHYPEPHRETQIKVFREQLELAKKLNMPVVIHDRDAHGDLMELLEQYRPAGVIHCYSGSAPMAERLVQLGLYIGFTGVVTFKNARRALEAAAVVPIDRLLIETDCPYMAPEPYRGQRCDSIMLREIAQRLAEIKNIDAQQLIDQTNQNARRVFGI